MATQRLTLAIFASLAKNRASPSLIGGVFLWVGADRFGAGWVEVIWGDVWLPAK